MKYKSMANFHAPQSSGTLLYGRIAKTDGGTRAGKSKKKEI